LVAVTINGQTAQADEGASLFDCAESLGIQVPTSCRKQGKCKECIVEVTAGGEAMTQRAGGPFIVIGENTIRGTFLRNAALISSLAVQAGLQLHSRRSRLLPMNRRYLPPPRRAGQTAELDGRIRREVILAFTKANNTE